MGKRVADTNEPRASRRRMRTRAKMTPSVKKMIRPTANVARTCHAAVVRKQPEAVEVEVEDIDGADGTRTTQDHQGIVHGTHPSVMPRRSCSSPSSKSGAASHSRKR